MGHFGTGAASVVVGVSGSIQSGDVSLSYQLSDPDSSYVFVEFEVSVDGAPFIPMRQAAASPPTFAVPTTPAGANYTFVWDSRADTTPGPHNCVARARATDGQVGAWSLVSPQFTISN